MLICKNWRDVQKSAILFNMKSLSLTAPHVVVMVGLPGAGKSFFAEHFSETFSAPLVNWNSIRTEVFDAPTYSKEEDVLVKRIADYTLKELLKTKATLLYEGDTLTQASRLALTKTIRGAGYEPLFVWVQTDAASSRSRAIKQGISAEYYDTSDKRFTPLKSTDPYVVISGKHTYASQLKIVLRKLSSARAAAADESVRTPKVAAPNRRVRIQ